jgi:hypothetical protein
MALVVLFIESTVMFNFFNCLMWYLTDESGMTDREAVSAVFF